MYTLRTIVDEKTYETDPYYQHEIQNHNLGESYLRVTARTSNFEAIMTRFFPSEPVEGIKCIIIAENNRKFLIRNSTVNTTLTHYIMTDNGKTFEKL